MARSGPARFAKRKREMEKQKKREAKRALRAERKALKAEEAGREAAGEDPDLKGIVPGPQSPRRD